jgi:putative tryptophan/tyrosine transport system substrate-binding protein
MRTIRRREFIAGLGSAAAWPLAAQAQQAAVPVIGFLSSGTLGQFAPAVASFMKVLSEAGFNEGQNLIVEQRWANNQYDRLPEMAAELVRARVLLIAAIGNYLTARAAKTATSTIPIVFVMGADPVALGLVDSLNRPGRNITGVSTTIGDTVQKRFQLLHDLVPNARRFGYLVSPNNVANLATVINELDPVRTWGGTVEVAYARTARDLDAAFAEFAERHVEAIVIAGDGLFGSEQEDLSRLAAQYAVPAIYGFTASVRKGGLMSYSAYSGDAFQQAALYAGRILKGEKPADLPVVQPTKFTFAINLKTAKALGLTIPETLLAIADEVIQ